MCAKVTRLRCQCGAAYCSRPCQAADRAGHAAACAASRRASRAASASQVASQSASQSASATAQASQSASTTGRAAFADEAEGAVPREPCPICLEERPIAENSFLACCSKLICTPCGRTLTAYEAVARAEVRCPLCRHPVPSDGAETLALMERNVARGDLVATTQLALYHRDGTMGLPVDLAGAAALYAKAARGGHVGAMVDLGAGKGRDSGQLQRRQSRSFSTRFGHFSTSDHLSERPRT